MPNQYYTTDYHGGDVWKIGFALEGNEGYVFTTQQPGTVPVYGFYGPNNDDHLYSQDPGGNGATLEFLGGYKYQGVMWYMYPTPRDGTAALQRWRTSYDNFYSTAPDTGTMFFCDYKYVGVLGYVCTTQQPNTVPLRRWYKHHKYQLVNGTTLKTWCYDRKSGTMRESLLNLDHCLVITGAMYFSANLRAIEAPDDLLDPNDGNTQTTKLSDQYAERDTSLLYQEGGNIDCRTVRNGRVFDSTCNIEQYLRRADDAVIEFVHPNRDTTYDWMVEFVRHMTEREKEPGEELVAMLHGFMKDWLIKNGNSLTPAVREFMEGTYFDGEHLIRRGT